MKKTILILLIISTSIFSQEVDQKVEKKGGAFEVFGGWSIPYDDNSDDINAGYNGGVSAVVEIHNHISVGGLVGFNKWTENLDVPYVVDIEVSLQYIETLGIIRVSTEKINEGYAFVQLGAGMFLGVLTIEIDGDSEIETNEYFGMSLSAGVTFNKFLIYPSYDYVFTKKGDDAKWFRLSLGFSL